MRLQRQRGGKHGRTEHGSGRQRMGVLPDPVAMHLNRSIVREPFELEIVQQAIAMAARQLAIW